MTKSHARRFVRSAWALLSFQLIASVGAVAVTGVAALHVSQLAAQLEQQPAAEPPAATEEAANDPRVQTPEQPTAGAPTTDEGVNNTSNEDGAARQPTTPATIAACQPLNTDNAAFSRSNDVSVVFRVPANVEWCDTGLVLRQGQSFVARAQGRWSADGDNFHGPSGTNLRDRASLYPRATAGTLLGRIGEQAFPINDALEATVPGSGPLYLSINDVPGRFGDNRGAVDVEIRVGQPAPG